MIISGKKSLFMALILGIIVSAHTGSAERAAAEEISDITLSDTPEDLLTSEPVEYFQVPEQQPAEYRQAENLPPVVRETSQPDPGQAAFTRPQTDQLSQGASQQTTEQQGASQQTTEQQGASQQTTEQQGISQQKTGQQGTEQQPDVVQKTTDRQQTGREEKNRSQAAGGIVSVPAETEPPEPEPDLYPEGSYTAGEDLPKGEYMAFADNGNGKLVRTGKDGREVSRSFTYNAIITAEEGQKFDLTGCHLIPINQVDNHELRTDGSGSFKIGMHIAAGTYQIALLTDGEAGTIAVYQSSEQETPVILQTLYAPASVTVANGQYLVLDNCRMNPAPAVIEKLYTDSDTVRLVQERLNLCGYSSGTPDGKIGNITLSAIRKFQEEKGLPVTGSINDKFLRTLRTACREAEEYLSTFDLERFGQRYDEAAAYFLAQENREYRSFRDAQRDGLFVENGSSAFLLEMTAKRKDRSGENLPERIRSVFYRSEKNRFGRQNIQEMALLAYALDESLFSVEEAVDLMLRLLYDSQAATEKVLYHIIKMGGKETIWMHTAFNMEI